MIHSDSHGEVVIGSGRNLTQDSPFLLGSISKSFTAIAVMQLVEADKIALDTEISRYLEAFSDRPSGEITIRQLLSHTSGFSTQQGNTSHTDMTTNKDELSRQVDSIAQWTPDCEPGAKWEYSNTNYRILGAVIASANDLARYLAIIMNGKDDIISADSKAAVLRPAGDASSFYGFGWFIDIEKGTVFHSGASPGTETLTTPLPAEKKGVVVLVNAGNGIGFGETTQLRNGISARALGLDYTGEGSRWQQKAIFIVLAYPATCVLTQHDLGMAPSRRASRQIRLIQPVVPAVYDAWDGFAHFFTCSRRFSASPSGLCDSSSLIWD